jgi:hypothetical protein
MTENEVLTEFAEACATLELIPVVRFTINKEGI